MSSWFSNPISQFACGVVAGVGAFVFASRGFDMFSNYCEFYAGQNENSTSDDPVRDTTSIDGDGIALDNSLTIHGDSNVTVQLRQLTALETEDIEHTSMTGEFSVSSDVEDQNKSELVGLLYHIAKNQACREGFIHRGITCNSCNVSPICGTRFKCANCIDYDVCEVCEPDDLHNRTHVFVKIKYPIPPLANPKTACLKIFYTGKGDNHGSLKWDEIINLKKRTHFNEVAIESLFEQFKTLAPDENGITREAFNQCLGPLGRKENLVIDRMFQFYDQNRDGVISFEEFVCALSVLVKGSQDEKLKHVFEGYDLDGKGYLASEDFHQMFKAYFNVSIELVRDYIKTCEEEMKASFDEAADKPVSSVFHAPIPNDVPATHSQDPKSLHQLPSYSGTVSNGAQPVMEAMSQDAIDEMVANVFKSADLDKDGKITFEEFKAWAVLDNTILAWFEALGTVF